MRNAFINTILDACAGREDIFIISGDAGLGVFDQFKEEFPHRFLNMGVAEQNMIGFAAGLAMTGTKVVLYNIIPFLLYRCYEQVRNDICYQKLPLILAGIGSGVTYAPMGMTHYSVEDIALARTLPNLAIISPIDPIEARLAAEYAISAGGPVYVRLAKRGEPEIHTQRQFPIMQPQVLAHGTTLALVCHGSITEEVLQARQKLAERGIMPLVISVPGIHPLDTATACALLSGMDVVVSIEEHYVDGGLGSILADLILERGLPCRLVKLGIRNGFIHDVSDTAGMRRSFGINADAIVKTAVNELELAARLKQAHPAITGC